MTAPYYSDEFVTLYHGDCREIAALLEGRGFVGIEMSEHYYALASRLLAATERGYRDDGEQLALDVDGGVAGWLATTQNARPAAGAIA